LGKKESESNKGEKERLKKQKRRKGKRKRGLAAGKTRGEGHFEAAAEIDVFNTAKARRHSEHIDTQKFTTGHCTALQRDEIQLHRPKHRHELPQPGCITGH